MNRRWHFVGVPAVVLHLASGLVAQTEQTLYSFTGGADGANPYYPDVIFDKAGNLYMAQRWAGARTIWAWYLS